MGGPRDRTVYLDLGGFVLTAIGLFHLPDQTDLGWLMIASGVAAVVCTLRYLGREAPRWTPAWVFSTISIACLAIALTLAIQREESLTEQQWQHYDQVRYARRLAAQTNVVRTLAARDTAMIGTPIAAILWGWLTWKACRAA